MLDQGLLPRGPRQRSTAAIRSIAENFEPPDITDLAIAFVLGSALIRLMDWVELRHNHVQIR